MSDDNRQTENEQPPLFADFAPPTTEAWREATVASLKGRPFEKLITRTYEGIDVEPIYRRADAEQIDHQHTLPGMAPYVRGVNAAGYLTAPWLVAQELNHGTPETANKVLKHDLERGQNAVNLVLDSADQTGVTVVTVDDVTTLLDGIDLESTPILVQTGSAALLAGALLVAAARQQGVEIANLSGSIGNDPLGELAHNGSLPYPLASTYDEMAQLAAWAQKNTAGLATVVVDGARYHDGGASALQELAFVVATGVDYLRAMLDRSLDIETAARQMRFSFAVGSGFFMEVAKLRAARLIWSQIVAAFGGSEDVQKMLVHARTSRTNKTAVDPYVNLLRATTEAFAGAVGGVASMAVAPFDEAVRTPDEFSRRIARNTQLVIQAEASMDRIIDPAGGSWYVEQLTDELAKGAWALFQEIEGQGGMVAALQAGFPQARIGEVAAKRAANLATRRDVLVGTNMYPNLTETPLEADERSDASPTQARYPQASVDEDVLSQALTALSNARPDETMEKAISAAAAGATLSQLMQARRDKSDGTPTVRPVEQRRLAEPYEALRTAAYAYADRHGHVPQVFLANMGPLAQHKARADFTAGFLAVGGFECRYPDGFDTVEGATDAALASGARAVVICSTDDTYPQIAPSLAESIKAADPRIVVLLAGYPQEYVSAFKDAGVDDFIHIRANCLEINRALQARLDVAQRQ